MREVDKARVGDFCNDGFDFGAAFLKEWGVTLARFVNCVFG